MKFVTRNVTSFTILFAGLISQTTLASLEGPLETTKLNDNNNNGNICKTSTSIDCYYFEGGVKKTCLSAVINDAIVPWGWYDEEDCDSDVTAFIEQKFCNRNNEVYSAGTAAYQAASINVFQSSTYFTYLGDNSNQSPFPKTLAPGQCYSETNSITLKKCKAHPMAVQFEGNMPDKLNQGNAYCYSYVFNKGRSKKIPQLQDNNPGAYTAICQEDSLTSSGKTNSCFSSVSIQCNYGDLKNPKSCIGPDAVTPFYSIGSDVCADNPIDARISMTMCNNNPPGSQKRITPSDDQTWFKFKGKLYDEGASSQPLEPGECTTFADTIQLNSCKKNWPMSVKLEGNMKGSPGIGQTNSFCYCYLFKKAVIENYDGLALPTPVSPPYTPPQTPDNWFDTFPAPSPWSPTNGKVPVPAPAPTPTNPWQDKPDLPFTLIITELADPSERNFRFIEFFSPMVLQSGSPYVIVQNIYLVRSFLWNYPAVTEFSLQGYTIGADGYLVFCVSKDAVKKCDDEFPAKGSIADTGGKATVYLREGDAIIDIYGMIPPSETTDYSGGNVIRLPPSGNTPNSYEGMTMYDGSYWLKRTGSQNDEQHCFIDGTCSTKGNKGDKGDKGDKNKGEQLGGAPSAKSPSKGGTKSPSAPSKGGTKSPSVPSKGGTKSPSAPSKGGTKSPSAPSKGASRKMRRAA